MNISHPQSRLVEICTLSPAIAAVKASDTRDAPDLARSLVSGGLPAVEVNFDDGRGIPLIEAIRDEAPEAILGVSGLTRAKDAEAAVDAGVQFASGAAGNAELLASAADMDLPMMPTTRSPEEARRLSRMGYRIIRWDQPNATVAPLALRELADTEPELSLCLSGVVGFKVAEAAFALPNIACVVADWLATQELVDAKDWAGVTARAERVASLSRGF